MDFFWLFKGKASKKGEQIADFIVSLLSDKDFVQLVRATPKPMSSRIMIDHLLVGCGAAAFALVAKQSVYESMIARLIFHLERMRESEINYDVRHIIVDEDEKNFFLRGGWKLNETTSIYTLFDVIGYHRMDRYSRAIADGVLEAMQSSDGARITAKLLQETKKNCGDDGYPYIELKLIYTDCIARIIEMCGRK